jgi:hypothetical protein
MQRILLISSELMRFLDHHIRWGHGHPTRPLDRADEVIE